VEERKRNKKKDCAILRKKGKKGGNDHTNAIEKLGKFWGKNQLGLSLLSGEKEAFRWEKILAGGGKKRRS